MFQISLKSFYENKSISLAILFYLILTCIDLLSTLFLTDLYPYLESNIIFPYVGILGILIVNIIIITIAYLYYIKSEDEYLRFIILLAIISFAIVKILIIHNNIGIYLDPPTLEEAMQVTNEKKLDGVLLYSMLNILPFVVGIITYILFRIDHKIKKY
jgi:uncharacterized membrane protein